MNKKIRKVLTALIIFLLPSFIVTRVLILLGHKTSSNCKFGFSLIFVDKLAMQCGTKIGHFNLLKIRRLVMRPGAYIGRGNLIYGPLDIVLNINAAVGNSNKISRGPLGSVTFGRSELRLGQLSKITANHRIDCTNSVQIGDFSTLAGICTQVWTHGYIHEMEGPDRYRIDGRVVIGNNVYIGSGSIISMGVRLVSGVIVGAGTTVARNLDEPGLYVSSAIRQLPRPISPDSRRDLVKVNSEQLCERVYEKNLNNK